MANISVPFVTPQQAECPGNWVFIVQKAQWIKFSSHILTPHPITRGNMCTVIETVRLIHSASEGKTSEGIKW